MRLKNLAAAFAILICVTLFATAAETKTKVSKESFGKTPDGTAVDIYTLDSGTIKARIMTYGGIIVSLETPDRTGKKADIVLGHESVAGYFPNPPYFGALIGRYGNRIGHGTFKLEGKTYELSKSDGDNTLHGGKVGFDKVVWQGKEIPGGVELTYVSKDGDQGFPGTLTAVVRYTVEGKDLKIVYTATTDKPTVVNLTNHSYFNLAGQGNGDILATKLKINASRYTPVDSTLIPTGELAPVEGTPFDFRKPTAIGDRINADNEQIKNGKGYDHNWVLDNQTGKLAEVAEAVDATSGRVLQVLSTEPGVQFYTGNFLDGTITGKEGKVYGKRTAFCLETQHYPDSPNKPSFPSTELKPGQHYRTTTIFRFSAK